MNPDSLRNAAAIAASGVWHVDFRRNVDSLDSTPDLRHLEHELPFNALLIHNEADEAIMVHVGGDKKRRIYVASGEVVSVDQLNYERLTVENLEATATLANEVTLTMQRRLDMHDVLKTILGRAHPQAKEIRLP